MRDTQAKLRYGGMLTLAGNPRPDGSIMVEGCLASDACSIIMNVFYGARACRPDLVRAITSLACTMTKWALDCDLRLEALMGYIKATVNYAMVGWIGDPINELRLHLYADADFAGCQTTNRCTSAMFLTIEGPHSSYPVGMSSKTNA